MRTPISISCHAVCCGVGLTSEKFCDHPLAARETTVQITRRDGNIRRSEGFASTEIFLIRVMEFYLRSPVASRSTSSFTFLSNDKLPSAVPLACPFDDANEVPSEVWISRASVWRDIRTTLRALIPPPGMI